MAPRGALRALRLTLDTNVLVYAADFQASEKHAMAAGLVHHAANADCILTLQSLAEFYHVVTRKAAIAVDDASPFVSRWADIFDVATADARALERAMEATRDHGLGFWDALLWATAQQAGCRLLVSEDFQDGRSLGGVLFLNPFDPDNAAILDAALPRPGEV